MERRDITKKKQKLKKTQFSCNKKKVPPPFMLLFTYLFPFYYYYYLRTPLKVAYNIIFFNDKLLGS